jgi:threonine dehydrogenase-like Zn-dependent dehydrogenase
MARKLCVFWTLALVALFLGLPALAKFSTLAVFSDPAKQGKSAKISVGQWDLPDRPPAGYYRVKMIRTEICNTDRRVIAGTKTADVLQRKVVMGHEGIGRIYQIPEGASRTDIKKGDLVVVAPHVVESNDEWLKKGLPNLSPKMRHTGIQLNGVFANYMDFPEYTIIKIPNAEEMLSKAPGAQAYYDQMVMIEPLACVQRGYKLLESRDYFKREQLKKALILGCGPMGMIHALHIQNKFPDVDLEVFDIDPIRRKLAKEIPNLKAHVLEKLDYSRHYDLVVTATSERNASARDAIKLVKDNGVILLFSGIDMKQGESHPRVGPVDIEDTHRSEASVRLINHEVDGQRKSFYLQGTSGYIHEDFMTSIDELHRDLLKGEQGIFRGASTTVVLGLDNKTATDVSKHFHDAHFPVPALCELLKVYDSEMKGDYNVHNYLKVFVRHE